MNFILGSACGLALAGALASAASASTVTLERVGLQNSALVSPTIDDSLVEPQGPFPAGSLIMRDTATRNEFLAWCVEIARLIASTADYQVSLEPPEGGLDSGPGPNPSDTVVITPEKELNLSRLFTGYLDQTNTDVGAAAFQLAIWEIVEETSDNLSLTAATGERFASTAIDSAVITTANGFLAGLGDFSANYRITYFQNANSQDLITATPIPLPASVLLLGAGVGALAYAGRRRRSKAINA
jgi:hypothetical protein